MSASSASLARGRQAHLGVAHGRRRIAVHRAEIALPVDQRQAHGEILGHAHHGVVDRLVAVRVIDTHDVADHARGFPVRPVPIVTGFLHGVENAPMHRLKAVANVGQRAGNDHAHGVIEIRALHLVFDIDRLDVGFRWRAGGGQGPVLVAGEGRKNRAGSGFGEREPVPDRVRDTGTLPSRLFLPEIAGANNRRTPNQDRNSGL